jgi:hypothetical protein
MMFQEPVLTSSMHDDLVSKINRHDATHLTLFVPLEPNRAKQLRQLEAEVNLPLLELCRSLVAHHQAQYQPDELPPPLETIGVSNARVHVYSSATALFYAPSDPSGLHGMKRQKIRCTKNWRSRGRREDVVLVDVDPEDAPDGLQAARVKLIFSFKYGHEDYNCALVHWYTDRDNRADPDTGMRIVMPSMRHDKSLDLDVIPLDAILRPAHLMPVFGPQMVPSHLDFSQTLDKFQAFYLNSFIDHHMFDLIHKVRD